MKQNDTVWNGMTQMKQNETEKNQAYTYIHMEQIENKAVNKWHDREMKISKNQISIPPYLLQTPE